PKGLGCRKHRLRQASGKCVLARLPVRIGVRRAWRARDSDETRAEALEARKIDVAARRIDAALAAERRLHRLDRDAAGLRRTVAAVLAYLFVDHDALRRLRHLSPLATPALFCGAHLVVDQHRDAVVFPQAALHR